ncbi:unnamed protein product [Closterium sp. NIES-53]
MYAMMCTRPDLAYPLSVLSRFVGLGRHTDVHWAAAKRVLRYLRATSDLALTLGGSVLPVLSGYSDSSYADSCPDRRSSQGYGFTLGSGLISWRSTRSSSVCLSTCEAELKHIEVRYFFVRELVQSRFLHLRKVALDANLADIFTKAFLRAPHRFYVRALGLSLAFPHQGSAAALGASAPAITCARESAASAEALHTFTLESGASRCFFRDCTTVTPLVAPVPISLADPSGGAVVVRASTVLPCPAAPSGSLPGLHLPSFSTNLVSNAVLQNVWVDTFTPGGQRVVICPMAASSQVSASGQLAASCSWQVLSHQTLLWHHRLGHPSLPRLRSMHSHLLVSGLPRSLPPLPRSIAPPCLPCVEGRQRAAPHSSFPRTTAPLQTLHMDVKADVRGVLIPWIRATRRHLRERFRRDLPVMRLHSASSGLLAEFCRDEDIVQSFSLPASPQQIGIAERRIGLIMEVSRTSMIHAAAPHFLWPFAVRYAAHQLNLWPRVSVPETSPALCWMGEVGDASAFRDVTFDESVCFYRLHRHASHPVPLPPLFLVPVPPPVDPLPPQGPAPSAVDSGAAGGGDTGGEDSGGAGFGGTETGDEGSGGADSGGAGSGGAASPSGGGAVGAPAPGPCVGQQQPPSRLETLSPQQLREWVVRRGCSGAGAWSFTGPGATGAGGTARGTGAGGAVGAGGHGAAGAGGIAGAVGRAAGAGGAAGAGAAGARGAGGAGTGGARAASAGGAGAAGAGNAGAASAGGAGGAAGAGGAGAGGAGGARAGGTGGARAAGTGGARAGGAGGAGAGGARAAGSGGARAAGAGGASARGAGAADDTVAAWLPTACSFSLQLSDSLTERREPDSRASILVRARRRVVVPSPPASSLPDVADPESDIVRAASPTKRLVFDSDCPPSVGGETSLGRDVLKDRQLELEHLATAAPHLAAMLLCPDGDPDALDIPTLRTYVEAISGDHPSQWQTNMDAEMASWKSTGTYVDGVPPPGANIVDGMWILRVKRPPGSPPAFKTRYVARGFSQRQGGRLLPYLFPHPKDDYSSGWTLRRPVYELGQAPREWHDTLRTSLAALGFAPSTADPSMFLRTDTTLPPFYVLVYVDDLVFATADTEALALVKAKLQERHTCTDLSELRRYLGLQITWDRARRTITLTQSHMVHQVLQRFGFQFSSPQPTPVPTGHSLSALPSDESVKPSGPYP